MVIVMEKRIAKLIVGKAGGTAGKDSKTYKVSLPSKWVAELGLTDSKMEISFDGDIADDSGVETTFNVNLVRDAKIIIEKMF